MSEKVYDDYYRMAVNPCDMTDELTGNCRGDWRQRHVFQLVRSYDGTEEPGGILVTTFEFTNYIDAIWCKMRLTSDVLDLNDDGIEVVWGKPWRSRGYGESAPTLFSTSKFADGVTIPDYRGFMGGNGIPTLLTTDTAFFALGVPPEKVDEVDDLVSQVNGTKHYDSNLMLTYKGDRHFLQVTTSEENRLLFRAKFKDYIETEATL